MTTFPIARGAVLIVLAVFSLIAFWTFCLQLMERRRVADLSRAHADLTDLNATINSIPDPLIEISAAGEILSIHSAQRRLFHLPDRYDAPVTLSDVLSPEAAATMMEALAEAERSSNGSSLRREIQMPVEGGSNWFELSIARKEPANLDKKRYLVLCRDITERKLAEETILRLNRLYATLSDSNKVVTRVRNTESMLEEICRLAVLSGEMRLAWVGLIETDSLRVRPVAWFGEGRDYVEAVDICLDPEDPRSRGPFATALRENHPLWIDNFLADASLMPWHELAQTYKYGAAAVLPLHRDGAVIGGLAIYTEATYTFDAKSKNLLLDLVGSIDGAFNRISLEATRETLQNAIKASEEKFREITESTHEVVWSLDPVTLRYLYVSPSVQRLRGFTAEEVMARPYGDAFQAEVAEDLKSQIKDEVAEFNAGLRSSDIVSTGEYEMLVKDGSRIWTESVTKLVLNPRTDRVELHGVTRDITERKFAQEQMERLAYFDPLTGLANRTLLHDRIRNGLDLATRAKLPLALMFLDLDNFKLVNDNLGHDVGDRVLLEVAQRLSANLRESDTLAHTSGDEFVMMLPDSDTTTTLAVSERIRKSIAQPYTFCAEPLFLTASVGIALFPDDGTTIEQLMSNANTALHQVKNAGRNQINFFAPKIQERSARALRVTNALHQAIQRGEFTLVYQPQLELSSQTIFGAEALLRWNHPDLGPVSPGEFIPLAESSGLIIPISKWVMATALHHAHAWTEVGLPPLTVSVNISASQFIHGDLASMVLEEVAAEGFPPDRLELELTESVTLENPEEALAQMEELYSRGIRLAIDDFGTGYSSLSYLKRIRAHRLKIDQSFIGDLVANKDDRAIVMTIITLARSMGMRTIAEGVTTPEQLALLRQFGCDEIQGYVLSPPIPQDAFVEFVQKPVPFSLAALTSGQENT